MMQSKFTRALFAPKRGRTPGVPAAAAAAARAPLAEKFLFIDENKTHRPSFAGAPPKPSPWKDVLDERGSTKDAPPRAVSKTGRAVGLTPRERVQYDDLQVAHGALQAEFTELKRALVEKEHKLLARDSEVAHLRLSLERALMQLEGMRASAIKEQEDAGYWRSEEDQGIEGEQLELVQRQEEERALSADEMDWLMDIVEAREALEENSICHEDSAHRLAQLARRLEAVRDDRVALSSFDLSTIEGVLAACGLCQLPTPDNGNCQFYAIVQAVTQLCFFQLRAAPKSSKARRLLTRLELATGKLKRGIRGSAQLCFDKAYGDSNFVMALVAEMLRTDLDFSKTAESQRAILKGYLDAIATNASDLKTTVLPTEWGCQLTLMESSKALGRPIYVITECLATETTPRQVNFQRYAPMDPTGAGSMYMSVAEVFARSFKEWTELLLKDLMASKTQPNTAPVIVMLREHHYSAVVVDHRACDASLYEEPATSKFWPKHAAMPAIPPSTITEVEKPQCAPDSLHLVRPSLTHPPIVTATEKIVAPSQQREEPKRKSTATAAVCSVRPRAVERIVTETRGDRLRVAKPSANLPVASRKKPAAPSSSRASAVVKDSRLDRAHQHARVPVRARAAVAAAFAMASPATKASGSRLAGGARTIPPLRGDEKTTICSPTAVVKPTALAKPLPTATLKSRTPTATAKPRWL